MVYRRRHSSEHARVVMTPLLCNNDWTEWFMARKRGPEEDKGGVVEEEEENPADDKRRRDTRE